MDMSTFDMFTEMRSFVKLLKLKNTRVFKWYAGKGTQVNAVAIGGTVNLQRGNEPRTLYFCFFVFQLDSSRGEEPSSPDILFWRHSRGHSSQWNASFPCRSRWGAGNTFPFDSSRGAAYIFDLCVMGFSSLTGMQRCCHGPFWRLENGPLWAEGCWSAGTDVACAWNLVAGVQQNKNNV